MPSGGRSALVIGAAPVEPGPRVARHLAALDRPYVVAADGGAASALRLGLQPDVVLGDFDSLDPETLRVLQARGIPIESYPRDKDQTDGQLAIERALQVTPDRLVLLGFLRGPRLDHELANVLLLARIGARLVLVDEHAELLLLRDGQAAEWPAEGDEIVSLLALSPSVDGVRTRGLRWALDGERLMLGETRGISNEPAARHVRVSIDRGLLIVARHFGGPP